MSASVSRIQALEGCTTQETWGAGAVTGRCSSRPPLEIL